MTTRCPVAAGRNRLNFKEILLCGSRAYIADLVTGAGLDRHLNADLTLLIGGFVQFQCLYIFAFSFQLA